MDRVSPRFGRAMVPATIRAAPGRVNLSGESVKERGSRRHDADLRHVRARAREAFCRACTTALHGPSAPIWQGATPSSMMSGMTAGGPTSPQRVADILPAAFPALSERLVEVALRRDWATALPGGLGRRSEPGDLRNGTLEVRADNSPWLHELSMRAQELLAVLGARYGDAVRDLRFRLAPAPRDDRARPKAAEREQPAPPPRLTREEMREVDAMAAPLSDPHVARALRRLLIKDRLARRRSDPPGGRKRSP